MWTSIDVESSNPSKRSFICIGIIKIITHVPNNKHTLVLFTSCENFEYNVTSLQAIGGEDKRQT